MAAHLTWVIAVAWTLAHVAGSASTAPTRLGPGAGAWRTEPPEMHGMTSAGLAIAATQVAEMAPIRHCFLVVKDGVIVQESYYGESQVESKYESDSLAKTGSALLVLAAASAGLFDLDTPLANYGVKNGGWPPKWWPQVTPRHLLTQTGGCVTGGHSGVPGYEDCYSPPGSNWTYDSETFIEHLSDLLHVTTNQSSREWATTQFAAKLGLADLYQDDGDADDSHPGDLPGVSIGGGQMMSCRDHARFGQLLVNRGARPTPAVASGLSGIPSRSDCRVHVCVDLERCRAVARYLGRKSKRCWRRVCAAHTAIRRRGAQAADTACLQIVRYADVARWRFQ